jgi:hypothetical protein
MDLQVLLEQLVPLVAMVVMVVMAVLLVLLVQRLSAVPRLALAASAERVVMAAQVLMLMVLLLA